MRMVPYWTVVLIIFVLLFLSMTGCATDATKPEVVSKVEQLPPVRIPVLVRCLDPDQIPEIPPTTFTPDETVWAKAQQEAKLGLTDTMFSYLNTLQKEAMVDIYAFKIYALKADPLLKGCATEPQPTEVKK
jgi:hypothetical protein